MAADNLTIKPQGAYWAALLFGVFFGGYCLVYGVLVMGGVASSSPPDPLSARIGWGAFFVGFAAVVGLGCWRVMRIRFTAAMDSITVVNPFRRYSFRRDEVLGLRASRSGGWCFLLTRTRRRPVPVIALSFGARATLQRRAEAVANQIGVEFSGG